MLVKPIGYVKNSINNPTDDNWEEIISFIELTEELPKETLLGLDEFSHLEIIYQFHKVEDSKICYESRYPKNNKSWPKVGIFSQRGKNRPNKIGATICTIN